MVAPLPLRLQLLGEEESRAAAQLLAQRAQIESVRHGVDALPPAVGFAALAALADSVGSETDLAAVVGVSASGPTVVDLVSDGPHAIVGGTTGSGKSEFLITWILAMLRGRSPQQVTFLGVDFKGGATFDAIRDLPHCVGVITDLDAEECRRALASLGAELRHREAELAAHGLRSLDQAAGGLPFPRLVVVVDEYAALAAADPELHALFSDIAARGRSLGIHLILCTQRPAGVIREAVFANAPLRVCLRVASAADSVAVIGDTHAAEIRPSRKGLGVVGVIGGEMALVQFGLSADTDIAAARVPASAAPPPRRPWCPPLPARIALGDLPPPSRPGIPIGLLDLPEEQTQRTACYDPSGMGPLLVLGAHGSGKSELLAAVAAGSPGVRVVRVGADYSTLWDAVTWALDDDPVRVPESSADVAETSPGSPERSTLLLADDVDAAIAACPIEYRGELVDRLIRVLREGPSRGIVTVATMQRIPSDAHGVGSVAGTRLLLRMPGRSDYVLAGGTAALHLADAPPGRGEWQGARVQLALIDDRALPVTSREAALDVSDVVIATTPKLLVVSARPPQTRELIAAVLADTAVEAPPVNTADEWFGGWASAYRAGESTVVFDGCSHADIRMLTRVRELPPPWPAATRPLWVLLPSGRLARARLR
nr:FtsK/SpoIIIE domain-containing protein [Galbitalea soli]